MKRAKSGIAVVLAAGLSVAGCETAGGNSIASAENIGTILGAIGGAYLGSQVGSGSGRTAATVLGGLLGGYAGRTIAQRLTQKDYAYMNDATEQAVSTNTPRTWKNPDSGHSGTITPTSSYVRNGQKCTNFSQTVSAGGEQGSGKAAACQMPDGSWQILSA